MGKKKGGVFLAGEYKRLVTYGLRIFSWMNYFKGGGAVKRSDSCINKLISKEQKFQAVSDGEPALKDCKIYFTRHL